MTDTYEDALADRKHYLYWKLKEGSLDAEIFEQIKNGIPVSNSGNRDIRNALTRLRRKGFIFNTGTRAQPDWVVVELDQESLEKIRRRDELNRRAERFAAMQPPPKPRQRRTVKKKAEDLEQGDKLRIAGMNGLVDKAETVFNHTPASSVRIAMWTSKSRKKRDQAILFLPLGTEVKVSKW